MDERIKMTDQEIHNYFVREQKVMDFGKDFFKDICGCSIVTESCMFINDEVLPLSCYNLMDEILHSMDTGSDYMLQGGFVFAGSKQAYIRIGIDTKNSILNKNLKRIVRHEIIHYYLWLLGLPHDDDSLEFWCFCYVYDAGAYEELSPKDQKYYQLFCKLYDTYIADLPWNVKHILTGYMIGGLGNNTIEQYEDFTLKEIDNAKNIFNLKKKVSRTDL